MPFKNRSIVVNNIEQQGFDEYQIRVLKLILLIKNDLFLEVSCLFKHVHYLLENQQGRFIH